MMFFVSSLIGLEFCPSCEDDSPSVFSVSRLEYLPSEIRNDFSSCKILLHLKLWYTISLLVNSRLDLQHRSVNWLMVAHSWWCCIRIFLPTNKTNLLSNLILLSVKNHAL